MSCISATAKVLYFALLGSSEYPMVVANLCTILRAGRSYDARARAVRGPFGAVALSLPTREMREKTKQRRKSWS